MGGKKEKGGRKESVCKRLRQLLRDAQICLDIRNGVAVQRRLSRLDGYLSELQLY